MKKILFLVIAFVIFNCSALFSQENSAVVSAFQKTNVATIAVQINDEVSFIYGTTNETYTKSEFIAALNRFLRANVPTDIEVIHEGARGDSRFMICVVTTAKGNFRVHIFFKKINNQYLINQVRIEQSNG